MSKKSDKRDYIDPRVRRTRQLLRQALVELIPEKGYSDITVQDITDRATLNRATFYLHYRDKEDLLHQGMREILDELVSREELPQKMGDRLSYDQTREALIDEFEHVAENAAFYRVMLGEKGVWSFVHALQEYIYTSSLKRLLAIRGKKPKSPVEVELVLSYIASAYIGVIQWWLENDMPHPPEDMADKMMTIYRDGVYRALGYEVASDSFGF